MIQFVKKLFQRFSVQSIAIDSFNSLSERKTSVVEQIEKMRQEADTLAIEFKRCFDELQNRQAELQDLVSQANLEACEMRRCFQRSQQAYPDGDGATAKSLSLLGREHQRHAEDLNAEAQAIGDIGKLGKQKQERCRELNSKVSLLIRQERELENLSGISASLGVSQSVQIDTRLAKLSADAIEFLANMDLKEPEKLRLLFHGLSNPALDEQMAREIPEAIVEILRVHPSLPGLFIPLSARGPGARAWVSNLNNSNPASAAGTAYELLATRRLMHCPAADLPVLPSDQLAFGPKQQARYKLDETKTKQLLASLVQMAPKPCSALQTNTQALERRTVEADLQLY